MADFSAQMDDRGVREVSARLKLMSRIAAQSVNASAQHIEQVSVVRINDRLNLRRDYVENKFSVRRASPGNPTATVSAVDRPVQLRQYGARQEFNGARKAGVSVQVLRGGVRKTIRDAFLAPLKFGGGIGVFGRKGTARTPLKVLHAPSPGQMFRTIGPEMGEAALKRLVEDLFARTDGLFDTSGTTFEFSR